MQPQIIKDCQTLGKLHLFSSTFMKFVDKVVCRIARLVNQKKN